MITLTDENFEKEIQETDKPILVDFWAQWCMPCFILGPILEKVVQEYEDRLILAKVDLDAAPQISQKYGVDRIPMVVLFSGGKPISEFIGVRPEPAVREMLDKMLKDVSEKGQPEEPEGIEKIIQSYQEYTEKNGFKLNSDKETVERLIKGLLANEKKYGAKYCPCRRVTGDKEEDRPKICPCQWHREKIEKDGHCFCGLFYKLNRVNSK